MNAEQINAVATRLRAQYGLSVSVTCNVMAFKATGNVQCKWRIHVITESTEQFAVTEADNLEQAEAQISALMDPSNAANKRARAEALQAEAQRLLDEIGGAQ